VTNAERHRAASKPTFLRPESAGRASEGMADLFTSSSVSTSTPATGLSLFYLLALALGALYPVRDQRLAAHAYCRAWERCVKIEIA